MTTFLLKTEPEAYSFARLLTDKRAVWDGIANNAALGYLRTACKGDHAFIYHTGDEKAIVGLAEFSGAAYEDPNNPGKNPAGLPRFAVADLRPLRPAKTPLTLAQIKGDKRFKEFALVKQPRLSVMPVPEELDRVIRELTGL